MSKDVAEQPIALTFKEKDKMNQEMEDDIWAEFFEILGLFSEGRGQSLQ